MAYKVLTKSNQLLAKKIFHYAKTVNITQRPFKQDQSMGWRYLFGCSCIKALGKWVVADSSLVVVSWLGVEVLQLQEKLFHRLSLHRLDQSLRNARTQIIRLIWFTKTDSMQQLLGLEAFSYLSFYFMWNKGIAYNFHDYQLVQLSYKFQNVRILNCLPCLFWLV